MDDRISQLAEQKKREAAAAQVQARTQEEDRRRSLAQGEADRAANRVAVQALADKFGAWARRHHVPPQNSMPSGVTFPTGWILGFHTSESGEGYSYRSTNYALVLKANGQLITTMMKTRSSQYKWLRKTYYSRHRVDLALFSINKMEDCIAKIVAQSGKPWP